MLQMPSLDSITSDGLRLEGNSRGKDQIQIRRQKEIRTWPASRQFQERDMLVIDRNYPAD
jgi:hypothetical protein